MVNEDDEERPVDFIPEHNIFGQPKERTYFSKVVQEKPKPEFKLEPSFPIDRFLAGVIDIMIVGIIIHFINDVWLFPNQEFTFNKTALNIGLLIGCLYHGFFDSSFWQGTPGKRWLGIKISNISGERISFIRSIGRYLASGISMLVLFLGYVNIYMNKDRRAWHDIIAGTYVINDKEIDSNAYRKKRKNGYIIAILLFVVNCMIFANLYSLESDRRAQKAEAEQEKLKKQEQQKVIKNFVKTAKVAAKDFIYKDSLHGFSILIKKGYGFTNQITSFDIMVLSPDSSDQIGWMISRHEATNDIVYGNYLIETYKRSQNIKISNIKLLPFKNGYRIEQGNLFEIKDNGDTIFGIDREYIKNRTSYMLLIVNEIRNKPMTENETTKQIFDSFQITE